MRYILLPLYLLIFFGAFIVLRGRTSHLKLVISLPDLYLIAFFFYTFLPIIDCYIGNKRLEAADTLLFKSVIVLACLFIGILAGEKIDFITPWRKKQLSGASDNYQWLKTFMWGLFCFGCVAVNVILLRGGVFAMMSASYRDSYVEANNNIGALNYCVMPYALIFTDKEIVTDKKARIVALLFCSIITVLFFLGGNRNLAVMVVLAVIWSRFKYREFNLLGTFLLMMLAVIVLGYIAVFREYGISNIINGSANLNWANARTYSLSFANGELGTMLNFEEIRSRIIPSFHFPFGLGYSYFILPIINLVPKSLWPGKPLAYADYFSQNAFGTFDGIGYGFSPIYEAEVNYGSLWWMVFIGIGMLLISSRRKTSQNQLLNMGIMACIILNLFRIDFATCFKFYAMMWVFKTAYLMTLKVRFIEAE